MSLASSVNEEQVQASGKQGWKAKLDLVFEAGPNRTIVRRMHVGPLTIQRPFYPEDGIAHVCVLHPPGGVVGSDQLAVSVNTCRDAHALVTTPGATRFYRTEHQHARIRQMLSLDGGALEWFPQENILFSGCKVESASIVKMSAGSSLAWWEINCLPAAADTVRLCSVLDVFNDEKHTLRDRTVINDQFGAAMSCGMRNHSVTGLMLMTPLPEDAVSNVRKRIAPEPGFSATWLDAMLLVRYLGNSSEDAKNGFIAAWSMMRKSLNNGCPVTPRIWST